LEILETWSERMNLNVYVVFIACRTRFLVSSISTINIEWVVYYKGNMRWSCEGEVLNAVKPRDWSAERLFTELGRACIGWVREIITGWSLTGGRKRFDF